MKVWKRGINPDLKVRMKEDRDGVCNPSLCPAGSHPSLKGGVSLASMILLLTSIVAEAQLLKICELDPDLYTREILPKIEGGIPFELMSILALVDRVLDRKMIHISHNLWDEIITVKSNEQVISKFNLKNASESICKLLVLDAPEKTEKKRYKVRLLLNPMWSERMARLHLSVRADLENKVLIGIDWKKIAEEMPSEKVLMERELDL